MPLQCYYRTFHAFLFLRTFKQCVIDLPWNLSHASCTLNSNNLHNFVGEWISEELIPAPTDEQLWRVRSHWHRPTDHQRLFVLLPPSLRSPLMSSVPPWSPSYLFIISSSCCQSPFQSLFPSILPSLFPLSTLSWSISGSSRSLRISS